MLDSTTSDFDYAGLIESAKTHEQIAMRAFDSALEVRLTKKVGPRHAYGVYGLFRFGKLVYIGKSSPPLGRSNRRAKTSRKKRSSIHSRLRQHWIKISKRLNISVDEMTCKWIEIDPMDIQYIDAMELTLVFAFKPEWNDTGFGKCGNCYTNDGKRSGYLSAWDEEFPERDKVQYAHFRLVDEMS